MQVKTLDSLAASGVLKDKRVLIRSDLNVPRNDEGAITNDARIVASLPAIKTALLAGAAVMVTSHLGRPKEGVLRPEDSLQVVADRLGELLGREVPVVQDWIDGVEVKPVSWWCWKTAAAMWVKRSAMRRFQRNTLRFVTFMSMMPSVRLTAQRRQRSAWRSTLRLLVRVP